MGIDIICKWFVHYTPGLPKGCHWFRKIITKEHKLLGLSVIIEPGNSVLTHINLHLRFQLPEAFLTESWIITRYVFIHSFIHSGHFYSASSSPLPLRGAPDYS